MPFRDPAPRGRWGFPFSLWVSKQTRQDGFVKTYSLTAQEPWAGFEVGGGDLETPGEPHLQAWSLSSYSPGGSSISCI